MSVGLRGSTRCGTFACEALARHVIHPCFMSEVLVSLMALDLLHLWRHSFRDTLKQTHLHERDHDSDLERGRWVGALRSRPNSALRRAYSTDYSLIVPHHYVDILPTSARQLRRTLLSTSYWPFDNSFTFPPINLQFFPSCYVQYGLTKQIFPDPFLGVETGLLLLSFRPWSLLVNLCCLFKLNFFEFWGFSTYIAYRNKPSGLNNSTVKSYTCCLRNRCSVNGFKVAIWNL